MQSTHSNGVVAPGSGREHLRLVMFDIRDAVDQAIDQGCDLIKTTGKHGLKLVIPATEEHEAGTVPIIHASGQNKGRELAPAFKSTLRNHGLIMDGLATARGNEAGSEGLRRVQPPPRRPVQHRQPAQPTIRGWLYADDIIDVITEMCVKEKREVHASEVSTKLGYRLKVAPEDRTVFSTRVETEMNELFAHDQIQRRQKRDGGYLYSIKGFRIPSIASQLQEQPDETPLPIIERHDRSGPISGGIRHFESPGIATPVPQTIPAHAWDALRAAANAFADFCQIMADEQRETK